MSKHENRRKRSFVDRPVQGALIVRIVLYWAVCIVDIALLLVFWRLCSAPTSQFNPRWDEMWFNFQPVVLALLLLLPLWILDIIRFSNRFVGPILRLRRSMQQLARGEHVEPIKFRSGDFWQGLADEFNAVSARVQDHTTAEVAASGPEDQQAPIAVVCGSLPADGFVPV